MVTRVTLDPEYAIEAAHLFFLATGREPQVNPANPTVLIFDPDLTAEEQQIGQRILRLLRSAVRVTPAEWEALEPVIDSLRTHRTRSDAAWSGMSAANRDAALIDWNRSITDLLRVLLRD